MSSYFGGINNLSVTDIAYLKANNTLVLDWNFIEVNSEIPYTKYEVYRFIGDKNVSHVTAPVDIEDYEKINTTELSPSVSGGSGFSYNYTDDFSVGLPTGTTQAEILTDVKEIKRAVYYTILPFQTGKGIGTINHFVIPWYNDIIDNRAIKSQVLNNVYHEEGDRIWTIDVTNYGLAGPRNHRTLGRSAIDNERGYAWLGARSANAGVDPGYVFRTDLETGTDIALFGGLPEQRDNNGMGLAVNPTNGHCYAATYGPQPSDPPNALYTCVPNTEPTVTPYNIIGNAANDSVPCFSMTNRYTDPTKYYLAWNNYGSYGGVTEYTLIGNEWQESDYFIKNGNYKTQQINNVISGPDGTIFATTADGWVIFAKNSLGLSDPTTLGNPNASRIKATSDFHHTGLVTTNYLSGNDYFVYTYSFIDKKLYRNTFTADADPSTEGTFEFGDDSWQEWSLQADDTNAFWGIDIDNDNNVWSILYDIRKVYFGLDNDAVFPTGGSSRWPDTPLSGWPVPATSRREVEWMLLKDPDSMSVAASAAWNGIVKYATDFPSACLASDIGNWDAITYYQFDNPETGTTTYLWDNARIISGALVPSLSSGVIDDIRTWADTYTAGGSNLTNVYVTPGYTEANILAGDIRYKEFEGHYLQSLNLNKFMGSVSEDNTQDETTASFSNYTHPSVSGETPTVLTFEVSGIENVAPLADSVSWPINTSSNKLSTNGYDDFRVAFEVSTNPGAFEVDWYVITNDYTTDKNGNVNTQAILLESGATSQTSYVRTYDYHDPTQNGLDGSRVNIKGGGSFYPYVSGVATNVYGSIPPISSTYANVAVYERWPMASFDVNAIDVPHKRIPWLDCNLSWSKGSPDEDVGTTGAAFADGKIAFGTEPLSATIDDGTLARTWPISSWVIEINSSNPWNSFSQTYTLTTDDASVKPSDSSSIINDLQSLVTPSLPNFFRYGTYTITMTAYASGSSTPNINEFSQILSVNDFGAFSNFFVQAASTVPANYSDEYNLISAYPISAYPAPEAGYINTNGTFVSGYAPNLTVWFQDSSEPHTFPISLYEWNFGDYYNELSNTVTISATEVSGNFLSGCWRTDKTNHIESHAFTMPGAYQVTLCTKASNTNTQDCCARPENYTDSVFVYVEEIPPTGCFTMASGYDIGINTSVSGETPVTVFFNPSGLVAGSFPFCRIDWDFGDGSPIHTVTRVPSATYEYPITAYPLDVNDPRNIVVSHQYVANYVEATYTASMSAYVCNTNTMIACTGSQVVGTILPTGGQTDESVRYQEKRHLVSSRINGSDDSAVFVFEGDSTKSTYSMYMSSVNE